MLITIEYENKFMVRKGEPELFGFCLFVNMKDSIRDPILEKLNEATFYIMSLLHFF